MNKQANEKATWRNFSHDYLTEHFGDNEPLAVQQIVQNLFRNNPTPLPRFIVNHLALNGSEDVIDLGCGNGLILREIFPVMRAGSRIVGIDLSETISPKPRKRRKKKPTDAVVADNAPIDPLKDLFE